MTKSFIQPSSLVISMMMNVWLDRPVTSAAMRLNAAPLPTLCHDPSRNRLVCWPPLVGGFNHPHRDKSLLVDCCSRHPPCRHRSRPADPQAGGKAARRHRPPVLSRRGLDSSSCCILRRSGQPCLIFRPCSEVWERTVVLC